MLRARGLLVAAPLAGAVAAALALGHAARSTGTPSVRAVTAPSNPLNQAARAVLEELVSIDTTVSAGNTTRAAEAVRQRFLRAGFPPADVVVAGPAGARQNLVARYHGAGRRPPLLLLAHADVVDVRREDWSVEPFALTEKGGYFYGRGTVDMKDTAAAFIAGLLQLKAEGFHPGRDIVFALTAGEEGGDENGARWLIERRRDLVEAGVCLTEGGGGRVHEGRYAVFELQAAEKGYATFTLEARSPGGHSSLPAPGNAIDRLAAALTRVAALQFPASLDGLTRRFFAAMARVEGGSIGRDLAVAAAGETPDADAARRLSRLPAYNALLRSTCVTTGVEGGQAENALPEFARATVNCRLLPGETLDGLRAALDRAVSGTGVMVKLAGPADVASASPLDAELLGAVEAAAGEMWPGVPVVPALGTGATDARFLRRAGIPAFGIGPFREEDNRAHGGDERIGARQFYEEREFLYRLIKKLAG